MLCSQHNSKHRVLKVKRQEKQQNKEKAYQSLTHYPWVETYSPMTTGSSPKFWLSMEFWIWILNEYNECWSYRVNVYKCSTSTCDMFYYPDNQLTIFISPNTFVNVPHRILWMSGSNYSLSLIMGLVKEWSYIKFMFSSALQSLKNESSN